MACFVTAASRTPFSGIRLTASLATLVIHVANALDVVNDVPHFGPAAATAEG
jgi:hypothetical protein